MIFLYAHWACDPSKSLIKSVVGAIWYDNYNIELVTPRVVGAIWYDNYNIELVTPSVVGAIWYDNYNICRCLILILHQDYMVIFS